MTKEPKKTEKTKAKITKEAPIKKTAAYDENVADAFIMEVDEEVKNENLKAFWKKYGLFIVLFVALVLSATVSFETIKNWRENQFKAKTDAYIAANYQQTAQEMIAALEKIAVGNNGIYSELARIQIADLLLQENKTEEAIAMLQTLATNDELNPRIKNLAAIKLAAQKIDSATRSEIESLLTPVVAADDSWTPIAQEYIALAAVKEGDVETARNLYKTILQNGQISEEFKNRVQDMLTTLSDL